MCLLPSHADLDDAGIILHQLADRFPTQAPYTRQFAETVVFFKRGIFDQHGSTYSLDLSFVSPTERPLMPLVNPEEANFFGLPAVDSKARSPFPFLGSEPIRERS